MVVSDLDLEGIAVAPYEAYAPLVIDADAVLTYPATSELLQTVAGWLRQVGERAGSVDNEKLPHGGTKERWRKMARPLATEERLRIPVREGLDHQGE